MIQVSTDADRACRPRKGKSERSCVSCRKKEEASFFLRVVEGPDQGLVVDWRRNLGGRGAHVCANRKCVEKAVAYKSFDRAFGKKMSRADVEGLLEMARVAMLRRTATLLSSCRGTGALGIGTDEAKRALGDGKAISLILAEDASVRRSFEERAAGANAPVSYVRSKELLGELLDRRPTGVVAIVREPRLSVQLSNALGRLMDLA